MQGYFFAHAIFTGRSSINLFSTVALLHKNFPVARKRKLEKIADIKVLPNVFEQPAELKGNWKNNIFENEDPITVEIGCGRGEYTVSLGRMFPGRNFVGVDIKGPRIWKGARIAFNEKLQNVAFIRSLIETITDYFSPGEVDEIWVTFPDPYPKPSKAQKRLISNRFLSIYSQILKPGGLINFKTDNAELFDWAVQTFKENPIIQLEDYTSDLYHSPLLNEVTAIKTTYEEKFLAEGKIIKYARLRLRN
jgi:tRNA (guanine-N7-)-methyltransferase